MTWIPYITSVKYLSKHWDIWVFDNNNNLLDPFFSPFNILLSSELS